MKNLSKDKVVFLKKIIGLCSALLCLLMLFLNFIDYTSSSTLLSGGNITKSSSVSLFNFIFNKDHKVFDGNISILREVFKYSYVIMWISFILILVSIIIFLFGYFYKKSLLSKIGSFVLLAGIILLGTMFFDKYSVGNTVRYLNVFTLEYCLCLFVCVFGLVTSFNLDNK